MPAPQPQGTPPATVMAAPTPTATVIPTATAVGPPRTAPMPVQASPVPQAKIATDVPTKTATAIPTPTVHGERPTVRMRSPPTTHNGPTATTTATATTPHRPPREMHVRPRTVVRTRTDTVAPIATATAIPTQTRAGRSPTAPTPLPQTPPSGPTAIATATVITPAGTVLMRARLNLEPPTKPAV